MKNAEDAETMKDDGANTKDQKKADKKKAKDKDPAKTSKKAKKDKKAKKKGKESSSSDSSAAGRLPSAFVFAGPWVACVATGGLNCTGAAPEDEDEEPAKDAWLAPAARASAIAPALMPGDPARAMAAIASVITAVARRSSL